MSTNYYFKIKNSDEIKNEVKQLLKEKKLDFVLGEKILNDEGWIFNDEIHIGKKSIGWIPLFEKTNQYSSVKELIEFYEHNKDKLIIIDEYSNEITFSELKEVMFNTKEGKSNKAYYDGFGVWKEDKSVYEDSEGFQFNIGEFS